MVDGSGGQHGQQGPTATRPTYRLIQGLRAVAALMVVVHHATIMLQQRNHLPIGNWMNGGAGVDLFFVISGFVMTLSAAPLRFAAHPGRTFLARRIERVVPMYWLVTTCKVIVLLLVPALGLNVLGSVRHVVASYLFLPTVNAEHFMEPVVVVGWTLGYEMAFYALFALALAVGWRPLAVVAVPLAALPLLGFRFSALEPWWLHYYANTLLWEFLGGMLLGVAVSSMRRMPGALGWLLVLGGLIPLFFWREPILVFWRGLLWGVPALAVVAGAISLEARWGARCPRFLLALGDASYSIYLIHTFTLPAFGILLSHGRSGWPGEVAVSLVLLVVMSTASGWVTYRLVERPMTDWFKGRRRTAVPAVA